MSKRSIVRMEVSAFHFAVERGAHFCVPVSSHHIAPPNRPQYKLIRSDCCVSAFFPPLAPLLLPPPCMYCFGLRFINGTAFSTCWLYVFPARPQTVPFCQGNVVFAVFLVWYVLRSTLRLCVRVFR